MVERVSIGKERAIASFKTLWWTELSPHEIVRRQIFTLELCCPSDVFHYALECSLGREVSVKDLSAVQDLISEFLMINGDTTPTHEEVEKFWE